MKTFRINYKNGNKPLITKALAIDEFDGFYVVYTKHFPFDNVVTSTLSKEFIESIEEV